MSLLGPPLNGSRDLLTADNGTVVGPDQLRRWGDRVLVSHREMRVLGEEIACDVLAEAFF